MPEITVAYFVTPHGFGHAARAAAVMEALGRRDRRIRFEIVTTVPKWLFEQSLSVEYRIRPVVSDVGLVQIDPVREDLPATLTALSEFWTALPAVAADLVEQWSSDPPRLVVSDISPLGLAVASRLGVSSALVENFTWDWIYAAYFDRAMGLREFADRSSELTKTASLHIQCDPACRADDTAALVGPVSRTPRRTREEVRAELGLDPGDERPMVVLTMGGMGWSDSIPDAGEEIVLVTLGGTDQLRRRRSIVNLPDRTPIYSPDLVSAADAVIGKLGYSTVAECFRGGTRFGYIGRPVFPESPVLKEFVERAMTAVSFERDAPGFRWEGAIAQLLAAEPTMPRGRNGAGEIADLLLGLIR